MATITRPDPAGYTDTPWTDQNGQRWLADSKGRWSIYVDPPEAGGGASAFADLTDKVTATIATTNTSVADALAAKLSSATAASTYALKTEIKSTDFTAESNRRYVITATCTVTLPSSPTNGDIIEFLVNAGTMSIVAGSSYEASPVPVIARRASPFWFMQSAVPIATGIGGLGTGVATALAVNADATGGIFRQGQALSASTLKASGNGSFASPSIQITEQNFGIYRLSYNQFGITWDAADALQYVFHGRKLKVAASHIFAWTSGSGANYGSDDTGIARSAAGVVEINNGTAGTLRDISLRHLTATGNLTLSTSSTPASASATGTTGMICWDSSYIYVCVATNTWKRVAIATW